MKRYNKKNVLVIGDTHLPYTLEGYLDFVKSVQKKYKCGTVVHIGDLMDLHGLSYHEKDPDLHGPAAEIDRAKELLAPWFKAFPKMHLCYGNHDRLPMRKAKSMGLPSRFVKSMGEIIGAPKGWEWGMSFLLDGILYYHGDGTVTPATSMRKACSNGLSIVHGHAHSNAGVYYMATEGQLLFAMNVGCGLDRTKKAFDYQKFINVKPVIGCGVVLEGQPIFVPMQLGNKLKFIDTKRL